MEFNIKLIKINTEIYHLNVNGLFFAKVLRNAHGEYIAKTSDGRNIKAVSQKAFINIVKKYCLN